MYGSCSNTQHCTYVVVNEKKICIKLKTDDIVQGVNKKIKMYFKYV